MTLPSAKTQKAVVRKLATDVLVLHASLVLTEPSVNDRQMRLAFRMSKAAKSLLARHLRSKDKG